MRPSEIDLFILLANFMGFSFPESCASTKAIYFSKSVLLSRM